MYVYISHSVLAVHMFGDQSPEYFADLKTALFSFQQIVTGDSWSSGITILYVILSLICPNMSFYALSVTGDPWSAGITRSFKEDETKLILH